MKKWVFPVLLSGVILGALFVNLLGGTVVEESDVFGNSYMQRLLLTQPRGNDLFWYIAGTRLKEMAMLILVMLTPFGNVFLGAAVFCCGFVNGMLTSIGMIQQGLKGVVLFWLLAFPAYLFFYPGLFRLCIRMRQTNRRNVVPVLLMGILITMCCSFFESFSFLFFIKKFYL